MRLYNAVPKQPMLHAVCIKRSVTQKREAGIYPKNNQAASPFGFILLMHDSLKPPVCQMERGAIGAFPDKHPEVTCISMHNNV
jgi:hypothetical protein